MSKKLIAIVGPTASGKTSLSLQIAQRFGGEIIAADSRTVYRGMDIGTAKPSKSERGKVPHFGLDLVNPNEKYSASEFKKYAKNCINSIWSRGNLAVIVGGTGLYVDAVLYDYQFPPEADPKQRAELESKPLGELVDILKKADPIAYEAVDLKNPRRVVRAIEVAGSAKSKNEKLPQDHLYIGINPGLEVLHKNIAQRTKQMIKSGLIEEVTELKDEYGANCEALNSPGYSEVVSYLEGNISLEEAESQINLHTAQLARRQITWFKRNQDIRWAQSAEGGLAICDEFVRGKL